MNRRYFLHALAALGIGLLIAFTLSMDALAQGFPTKPIRLVVPFAPGGTTDIVARIVADRMTRDLGQPVIVENRSGGGGTIGADLVAKSAPDGYTLGMATVSTMATNPATNPRIPYDAARDFSLIINLVDVPNVLIVNPTKVPSKDVKEFVALLAKNPGRYSFASSGSGGLSHLDFELFKMLTKTFLVHIPYRGTGPAMNDTIAGQVDAMIDNLPSALPHIRSGKVRALAVMAEKRIDALAGVPTFAEVGLKDANNMAWYGLLGPAGLPQPILRRVHEAAVKALNDPESRKRLADGGSIVDGGTPEAFAQKAARELALRREIVTKQNIKVED
jgi:tripartite-type tricarboxylate transporter receptor subunit TctC